MKLVPTTIAGLALVKLDVFEDNRGSFREAYQQEKLRELGVDTPAAVQMNVAESRRGVIRGIHAEPWDKYIHVAEGEVFAALVDLRKDSQTFRKVETVRLGPRSAVFVPEGLGNSYAVLSDRALYTYLVPKHWSADADYQAIAYDDPELGIDWPIPKDERIVSEKDRANPTLNEAFGG